MGDGLAALLRPSSVAIVGLSADPSKHGSRVLGHLRRLGYGGEVWGVNPKGAGIEGVTTVRSIADLPEPPDVVVCAIPAPGLPMVVREAVERGAGAAVVFSGGFAESGSAGRAAQEELAGIARAGGMRLLGPSSGGVINPGARVALSFLTCLDRPAEEVRTGPVGVVTQSGGTGSYLHNLAAARGGGLAATISTGNEADVGVGDAIAALVGCEEVRAVAVVLETVRDGRAFMDAVREARRAGKPVVACRLGTSRHGQELMRSHTGALALPARVIEGVCDALGVTLARTPAELLDVAEVMARARTPAGGRVGVVTHSGGTAILLSDLAAESAVQLPRPPEALVEGLRPLLSHGSPANPVDLGAIIGGPHRFGEVVGQFLGSGAYDTVLAVSTPHPPAHSVGRARQLAELDHGDPTLVHLWMAGDLGAPGLEALRRCGAAVTEEPRAAIRAVAGLARLAELRADEPAVPGPTPAPEAAGGAPREVPREPATAGTLSEQGSKTLLAGWGLPVVEGDLATTSGEAVEIAARIGYPVVVKASAPELAHKSDVGGVRLDLSTPGQVREAFEDVLAAAGRGSPGVPVEGARVERYRPGPEVILGCVIDADFGPTTLVGIGGMDAELLELVSVAPAPLSPAGARRVLARMPGRALLGAARRDGQRPDVEALADLVSQVSIRFCEARGRFAELEMNPLTWSGGAWRVVDALVRLAGAGP